MDFARQNNVSEVFLITNTAENYFKKQGFIKKGRQIVPQEIQDTTQFIGVCLSSATIMSKIL